MQRRTMLRRLAAGATTGAGLAATGNSVGAAHDPSNDGQATVRWRFDDGHAETLTLAAFDAHPDTPAASALRTDAALAPECCCCKGVPENCADCSPCPCDGETLASRTTLSVSVL